MGKIITLTTDFGIEDHYVGSMKGVILGINPEARLVDVTHSIVKYDIFSGALTLRNFYSYYPKGTIHLVVVDPGVGSERKPLAVKADSHYFIGPDNGVLSFVLRSSKSTDVFEITNTDYMLEHVSNTFHGRDIFAPVAAHLSCGVDIKELGCKISDPVLLDIPEPQVLDGRITGRVMQVDSFGNLITNIPGDLVKQDKEIFVNDQSLGVPTSSYNSASESSLMVIIGSSGFLEISVNQGSAYEVFGKDIVINAITMNSQ